MFENSYELSYVNRTISTEKWEDNINLTLINVGRDKKSVHSYIGNHTILITYIITVPN